MLISSTTRPPGAPVVADRPHRNAGAALRIVGAAEHREPAVLAIGGKRREPESRADECAEGGLLARRRQTAEPDGAAFAPDQIGAWSGCRITRDRLHPLVSRKGCVGLGRRTGSAAVGRIQPDPVVTFEADKSIAAGQEFEPLGVSMHASQQFAPLADERDHASVREAREPLRLVKQEARLEEIPAVAHGDKAVAGHNPQVRQLEDRRGVRASDFDAASVDERSNAALVRSADRAARASRRRGPIPRSHGAVGGIAGPQDSAVSAATPIIAASLMRPTGAQPIA